MSSLQFAAQIIMAQTVLKLGIVKRQKPADLTWGEFFVHGTRCHACNSYDDADIEGGTCTAVLQSLKLIKQQMQCKVSLIAFSCSRSKWSCHRLGHWPVKFLLVAHHPILLYDVQINHACLFAGLLLPLGHREVSSCALKHNLSIENIYESMIQT